MDDIKRYSKLYDYIRGFWDHFEARRTILYTCILSVVSSIFCIYYVKIFFIRMCLAPRKILYRYFCSPSPPILLAMRVKANRSLNSFRPASASSVPRDRGVRGAARGLERELKASERHRKKRSRNNRGLRSRGQIDLEGRSS